MPKQCRVQQGKHLGLPEICKGLLHQATVHPVIIFQIQEVMVVVDISKLHVDVSRHILVLMNSSWLLISGCHMSHIFKELAVIHLARRGTTNLVV